MDRFIWCWGCWEPNQTWAIKQLLCEGDFFIDVGANSGYFTLLASKIVGAKGKVIAFEPVPPMVDRLLFNLGINKIENVIVHNCAVSDKAGKVRINKFLDCGYDACSMRKNDSVSDHWDVPGITLDAAIGPEIPVHFVKIDAEGAEWLVLKGFVEHLKAERAPIILCEMTQQFLVSLGSSVHQLLEFMFNFGYRTYSCNRCKFSRVTEEDILRQEQIYVVFSKTPLC